MMQLKMTLGGSASIDRPANYPSIQCALAKSQLTDVLWVSLDHTGTVTGVTQSVSNGNMNNCLDLTTSDVDVLDEFNTDVYVKHTESAPIPDTASFIQKMEREREARERGETKDNRSFFAKYVSDPTYR